MAEAGSPSEKHGLVFVTGASSGLGRALVECVPFAARIVGISRRPSPAARHVAADLAEADGWELAAKAFEAELSGFAGERVVFLHAAGTLNPIGFAGEVDAEDYRRQVLLNAACPLVLGDAFLRAARHTRAPCDVILISSGAAQHVYPGWSAYGAGKAAVDQWVRTVGPELTLRDAPRRVAAIAPGVVATPMQEEIRATAERDFPSRERFRALHEAGELRDPRDAAREIWALLEAGFENGAVLDLRNRGGAQR